MNDPPRQLPCSSNSMISISAMPTPSVRPPCTWPSMIMGLIWVPQSSTATNRRTVTCAVPGSMSTTQMYAPNGIGQVLGVVADLRFETALDALGQVAGAVGLHGDVLDGHRLRRVALDLERALHPFEVGHRHLEHARCDDLRLVPHLAGHQRGSGTRHRRRPAAVGAETERGVVGVAVDDLDVLGRDADLLGDDLGEGRLVALALRLHRQAHHAPCRSGWMRSSQPSAIPRPRMSMSLRGPAPTASVKKATPMPMSSPRSRFSACSRRSSS